MLGCTAHVVDVILMHLTNYLFVLTLIIVQISRLLTSALYSKSCGGWAVIPFKTEQKLGGKPRSDVMTEQMQHHVCV